MYDRDYGDSRMEVNLHDGHYVHVYARDEGIVFEMETDTGEFVEDVLLWPDFDEAYQNYLSHKNQDGNDNDNDE